MVVTVNLGLSENWLPPFSLWFRKSDSLSFGGHVAGQSPTFRHTYIYIYIYVHIIYHRRKFRGQTSDNMGK